MIRGLSQRHAEVITAKRGTRPYASFESFVARSKLPRPALVKLAKASAFASLELTRRQALWLALPQRESLPLFDIAKEEENVPESLPPMTPFQETLADYEAAGLTLRQHPMHFLRPVLNQLDSMDRMSSPPTRPPIAQRQ